MSHLGGQANKKRNLNSQFYSFKKDFIIYILVIKKEKSLNIGIFSGI